MLRDAPPIAFVATTDAARTRAFYEGTLGLTLIGDERFALVFDMAGTMLRIAKVRAFAPQPFAVLGWRVPDAAAAVQALTARGIPFERYEGLDHDELGIWSAPSGGRIAWFRDPDGNLLSITQL